MPAVAAINQETIRVPQRKKFLPNVNISGRVTNIVNCITNALIVRVHKNKQQKPKGEKMKKTLLSVLAGITVIGSAAAVPSLEDRITMCKRHPDTHVWVEKTQFCARIDPCVGPTYDDMYCIEVHGVTKPEDSYARLLIERYVKNILETGVEELNYLGNNKFAI